jgi:glyoxylase-like metal-dependent hydrolase (beta-lactamase superfamily II)
MGWIKIRPFCVGTATRNRADFLLGAAPEQFDVAFIMYFIETPEHKVIVDTGIPPPAEILPHHLPAAQGEGQTPLEAFESIGVVPEDIDIVVNTHLHRDHCENNHLFTNARIFAQRSEIQYAIAPCAAHSPFYDQLIVEKGEVKYLPPFLKAATTLIDGDYTISDHLAILHTPGHSPGSQSVLVRGTRNYLLAGDNVPLFANLPGGNGRTSRRTACMSTSPPITRAPLVRWMSPMRCFPATTFACWIRRYMGERCVGCDRSPNHHMGESLESPQGSAGRRRGPPLSARCCL